MVKHPLIKKTIKFFFSPMGLISLADQLIFICFIPKIDNMAKEKKQLQENAKKSQAGFLYLFAALARRASQEDSVSELKRLSGLIEAEISELQKGKNASSLRDVIKKKYKNSTV